VDFKVAVKAWPIAVITLILALAKVFDFLQWSWVWVTALLWIPWVMLLIVMLVEDVLRL